MDFWEIIISDDEENTKTEHAKDNQYNQRFGNLQGVYEAEGKYEGEAI